MYVQVHIATKKDSLDTVTGLEKIVANLSKLIRDNQKKSNTSTTAPAPSLREDTSQSDGFSSSTFGSSIDKSKRKAQISLTEKMQEVEVMAKITFRG